MEYDITAIVTRLVIELAVVLFAAKVGGEIAERYEHPGKLLLKATVEGPAAKTGALL